MGVARSGLFSHMDQILHFFNGALEELRHVRWPTRQQAVRLAVVVIGFMFACAAVFGALDYVFAEVIRFTVKLAV